MGRPGAAAPARVPLPPLLYLERYRNEGTRTYSRHAAMTEARPRYRPQSPAPGFDLPLFDLPRAQLHIATADPPPALAAAWLGGDRVPFAIHPQLLEDLPDEPYVRETLRLATGRRMLAVAPTASTRTLQVLEAPPAAALKVHFPFVISRYGRRMRAEVLEQALNVSRELQAGIGRLDGRFAFLREVIAVAHRDLGPATGRGEHWGFLVRDMQPFPARSGDRPLVPGFALYGADRHDPGAPALLFDLLGGRDLLAFVLEQIMLPIVRHWVDCFLHFGYLLEPHGQNVLLEIGPGGDVARIVHRDLSVGIDMRRRRDAGLSDSGLNGYNRMHDGVFASISYDRFMGGHFFDRLVALCQAQEPRLRREDFTAPCRAEFARRLPDHARYLPRTEWYFSETRDRYRKPGFEDTGATPQWRP